MADEKQDIETLPEGEDLPDAEPATRTPTSNEHLNKDYSQIGSDPIASISTPLRQAPLFDYMSHIASQRYPGITLDEKLEVLELEHPKIYQTAIIADIIIRILLISAILALVGFAIWNLIR